MITYSNNQKEYTDPAVIGMFSLDGKSITGVTEHYLATSASSGVTRQTSGWTTTIQTVTATNKYLWNYETISYSSGNPTETDPVIIGVYGDKGNKGDKGDKGDQGAQGPQGSAGKGISSITVQYALGTSQTTAPSSGWDTAVPAYQSGKYYWSWQQITYTSGNPTNIYTCENGVNYSVTQANTAAQTASNIASGATSVPYVKSSEFVIQNGDVTIGGTSKVTVVANKSLTFGCNASASAMVIDNNGVSIGSAKDIAIAANGSLQFGAASSGITINSNGITVHGSKYVVLDTSGYVKIGECFFQQNGFAYEKVVGSTYRYASVLVDSLGGLTIKSDLSSITITPNMEVGTYSGAAMFHKENGYVVFSGDGEKPDGTNYTKVSLGYGSDARYQIDQAVIKYIYWVNHCGQLSSREIKHNIRNIENVSDKIRALNPVRFVYNNDGEGKEQVGLIYEDTVNILPEVCFEHNGQKAVDYVKLVPFLLKEVQRLQDEVNKLKA
jgi:hypothetical protein